MYRRQVFQSLVYAVAILATASVALAGKPVPPPPSIATTTDQNFMNNVVEKVSSQTAFNLAIDVSGTGTHYCYKIGPAATTDPAQATGYSSPSLENAPLVADIAGDPDGDFVLCLQALQIDRKGNIKYVQNPPTVYCWVKSANTEPPQGSATVVPLAALQSDESQFKLAMDGYGNAVAIAPNVDAAGWHHWNCSIFDGSTWSAATRIVDALPDGAGVSQLLGGGPARSFTPILQTDGYGRYLFTWIEYDFNDNSPPKYHDVRAMIYDGTGWGSAQLINEEHPVQRPYAYPISGYGPQFNYGAAFSANGDAMIAWVYSGGLGYDDENYLITRLYTDGTWQPEVSHVSTEPRLPAVAADDNGNFMLAYVHGNTDGPSEGYVYYKLYDDTGWSDEARLNVHSNMIKAPLVYAGDDGVVMLSGTGNKQFAAAYLSQATNADIDDALADNVNVYGRYFNGTDWEAEYALDSESSFINDGQGRLRLAMSANGSAIAMWTQYDGTSLKVYASRCDELGIWDAEPTVLSYNTFGDAKNIWGGITMDAAGNALATFYDTPYPQFTVVKVHYLAGLGWQLTAVDDPDDLPFDRESLTFNPPASLAESRVAGQADGKATIIHTPLDPDCVFPVDHFISIPFGY